MSEGAAAAQRRRVSLLDLHDKRRGGVPIVMVTADLLGIFEAFQPRFVKRYAHLRRDMVSAVSAFAEDVRAARFPAAGHCYSMPEHELAQVRALVEHA